MVLLEVIKKKSFILIIQDTFPDLYYLQKHDVICVIFVIVILMWKILLHRQTWTIFAVTVQSKTNLIRPKKRKIERKERNEIKEENEF